MGNQIQHRRTWSYLLCLLANTTAIKGNDSNPVAKCIQPHKLVAYCEGKEFGIVRLPGAANPFDPLNIVEAWIRGSAWQLPRDSADPNSKLPALSFPESMTRT